MKDLEKQPKYKLDIEVEVGNKTISINNKKSKLLHCIDEYGFDCKSLRRNRYSIQNRS